jgi:hypothetical protein
VYECKTSFITSGKKVGNCLLERTFGFKSNKIIEVWRKLHNQKPHTSHFSCNITMVITSRNMKGIWYIKCMGQMRNAHKILARKPEGITCKT